MGYVILGGGLILAALVSVPNIFTNHFYHDVLDLFKQLGNLL